jgi:hypothetical protein
MELHRDNRTLFARFHQRNRVVREEPQTRQGLHDPLAAGVGRHDLRLERPAVGAEIDPSLDGDDNEPGRLRPAVPSHDIPWPKQSPALFTQVFPCSNLCVVRGLQDGARTVSFFTDATSRN